MGPMEVDEVSNHLSNQCIECCLTPFGIVNVVSCGGDNLLVEHLLQVVEERVFVMKPRVKCAD